MKKNTVITGFLVLSGLIGLYVGGGLVFAPAEMLAQSNIILGENTSQFSETRAAGSAILVGAIIILLGIFRSDQKHLSLVIASLFFLSYGGGRLLSLILDGMPEASLFYTMFGELIMGVIAIMLLRSVRKQEVNHT